MMAAWSGLRQADLPDLGEGDTIPPVRAIHAELLALATDRPP
jgi:hypothetical protein